MKKLAVILLSMALMSGCSRQDVPTTSIPVASSTLAAEVSDDSEPANATSGHSFSKQEPSRSESALPEPHENTIANAYINGLVEQTAAKIEKPGMTEYERVKAAFDYMIENTVLDEPIGPALWRVHGGGEEPIPFIEQRALSPLRFGVGMCEDYAAALTLLLRGLDLEAQYVPGLTYSLEGHLVDHAWTVVRIDGVWYHLDCQLEDNISRRGTVRYRYFLRSDATMAGSHLWGQRLIRSGLLTAEQNAELEANYLAPDCPRDYPTPEPHPLADTAVPNIEALRAQAWEEIAAYEAEYGPLPPMELNTTPPVFGLDGYGPADEG